MRSDYKYRGYDEDTLRKLFIEQNLSAQKIATIYNIPKYCVESDLKKWNIKKPKEKAVWLHVKQIDKDDLYNYYIIQNHTIHESAIFFGVGDGLISNRIHKYGFIKSIEELYQSEIVDINKDALYQYYITENHNTEDTAKHFNCHERTIRRRLRAFGITKTLDQQVQCSKEMQKQKYGDLFVRSQYYKDNVCDHMLKVMKHTCQEKYGVDCVNQVPEFVSKRNKDYEYNGLRFDSSWELALYIYAIDHDEDIAREPCYFDYFVKGEKHRYFPDFRYKGELIEIKGDHLVDQDGNLKPFGKNGDPIVTAAKQQCLMDNGVKMLRYKDVRFALQYVEQHYGKKYLQSYRKEVKKS